MIQFNDIYIGRKVILTGHTGFKGSWLGLWLKEIGAKVTGISLKPDSTPNHWQLLNPGAVETYVDIRDFEAISAIFKVIKPEIVFHLAAQALVRRSYKNPIETWSTNVSGAASVLECCRMSPSVKAIIVVTSDKCYENQEWPWGYRENDRLGGYDPYSASKAAEELVTASYRRSFFDREGSPLLASTRAGNVIGGGDWAEDRLIPDLIRSVVRKTKLEIRSPNSTRPWQHVLESLSGYLLLGQRLLEGQRDFAEAWNFGPDTGSNRTVLEVLSLMKQEWSDINWHVKSTTQPHEANLLYLDTSKARVKLGWNPVWSLKKTLNATTSWYRMYLDDDKVESQRQITHYVNDAHAAGEIWCRP